jgi:hypothetical protein
MNGLPGALTEGGVMKLATYHFTKQLRWSEKLPVANELDSPDTAIFIFGAPELKDKKILFQEINLKFPLSKKIGCSDSGEIYKGCLFDESLAIAIAKFHQTRVRVVHQTIENMADSFLVGQELAKKLQGDQLASVFVVSDGLMTNGSELVRGLNSVLPGVVITGGLAGAGKGFKTTWVLQNGFPESGVASALGLYGNYVHVEHGSKGGWDTFGPERIITKSRENILYELDGRPALKLYKEYLGDQAINLPASALLFPLQLRANDTNSDRVVRTVLGIDEEENAMIFAGNVPQGSLAQLMMANFDRLVEGAASAAEQVSQVSWPPGPILTIAISCVGRRLVLGERIDEEIDSIVATLPSQAELIGFYSNGEISPLVRGQACALHNQTMTITAISEGGTP